MHAGNMEHLKYNEFRRFMNTVSDGDVKIENSQQAGRSWVDDFGNAAQAEAVAIHTDQDSDWVRDFAEHKAKQGKFQIQSLCSQIETQNDYFFIITINIHIYIRREQ